MPCDHLYTTHTELHKMLFRIFILLTFISEGILAQNMLDTTFFDSPIRHDIVLAGSFGELRTTHFHAGIDIKPSKFNTEGDSIFVAGPGHISRIKIQEGGYGHVLYIDHPNGYTSVYAHMQVFQDSIESYIQDLQLSSQSYEIDIYPQPNKFVIPRGAFLGLLGNSGRSYGAHLHFEIRNTISETPINPLLFGIGPTDSRAPTVPSVSIHGLSPDHQQTHFSNYPTRSIDKDKGLYTINDGLVSIPAWRVGVLLQGWDRMDGASNKNGIYRIEMRVDDTLHYGVTVDSINWSETAYIKTHVDYADRKNNKRTAVRCYQMPNNPLSIYDNLGRSGIFSLYSNQPRKINIVASDFEGNTSIVDFKILRDSEITSKNNTFEKLVKYNKAVNFKLGSSHISIKENSLDRDLYLSYSEYTDQLKTIYHIHKDEVPIYSPIQVTVPIQKVDSTIIGKLCAVSVNYKGLMTYAGGKTTANDSLTFYIKAFGDYRLHIDTIPPTVQRMPTDNKEYLTYKVEDELSDITVNTYVDNRWVITPYKVLDKTLKVYKRDLSSEDELLKIVVMDANKNRLIYTEDLRE